MRIEEAIAACNLLVTIVRIYAVSHALQLAPTPTDPPPSLARVSALWTAVYSIPHIFSMRSFALLSLRRRRRFITPLCEMKGAGEEGWRLRMCVVMEGFPYRTAYYILLYSVYYYSSSQDVENLSPIWTIETMTMDDGEKYWGK